MFDFVIFPCFIMTEFADRLDVMWESNCHVHAHSIDFDLTTLPARTTSLFASDELQDQGHKERGRELELAVQSEEAALAEAYRLAEQEHPSSRLDRLPFRINRVHTVQVCGYLNLQCQTYQPFIVVATCVQIDDDHFVHRVLVPSTLRAALASAQSDSVASLTAQRMSASELELADSRGVGLSYRVQSGSTVRFLLFLHFLMDCFLHQLWL